MRAIILALSLGILASAGLAKDNLSARPEELPPLEIGADLTFSQTEYRLETGKSYRLTIESGGDEEYSLRAPDFFRNIWLESVTVDEVSIKADGIYALDFEEGGTVTLQFVPIRPGKFSFWVRGYETRGLSGAFMVD